MTVELKSRLWVDHRSEKWTNNRPIKTEAIPLTNPYNTRRSPCGIWDILDSSTPIMAQKISTDIPGGCSEAVRTPPEVNGHCQKSHGPIGMVREEGHRYVI